MSKDWMQTYTNRKVFPLDFKAEDIRIEDIARSLAFQCRYNGHVNKFYSVAEHSDLMRRALKRDGYPEIVQKCGFLHDASEVYTGDVIRPLKNALRSKGFDIKPFELDIEKVMSERFGLPWPWPDVIVDYDKRIVRDEKEQLKPGGASDWSEFDIPKVGLGVKIEGWSPLEGEHRWLSAWDSNFA